MHPWDWQSSGNAPFGHGDMAQLETLAGGWQGWGNPRHPWADRVGNPSASMGSPVWPQVWQVWDPRMVLAWLGILVRMQRPGTPGWHQRSWCGHGGGQGYGHKCDHGDLIVVIGLTGLGTLVWTWAPLELEVLREPCCGHDTGRAGDSRVAIGTPMRSQSIMLPPVHGPPGPSAGHGQAPQGTGGQEEEEEDEAGEEEKVEEEEAGMPLVTRHKRHPSLGEGQAIVSVIIYRTLAGLLPQHFDADKRSLRCHWGWGPGGLGVAHGVSVQNQASRGQGRWGQGCLEGSQGRNGKGDTWGAHG